MSQPCNNYAFETLTTNKHNIWLLQAKCLVVTTWSHGCKKKEVVTTMSQTCNNYAFETLTSTIFGCHKQSLGCNNLVTWL